MIARKSSPPHHPFPGRKSPWDTTEGWAGIHHLRDIRFEEATNSASFYADMGDAEGPPALSMLVRILESFSGELAIEAVVFGRG